MGFFYLHPLRPQFFFPENFETHRIFHSLFQPYSRKGRLSWWLFQHFRFYRNCFWKHDIEAFIPIKEIQCLMRKESLMAFNSGTPGPEQKITGLGWHNENYFFFKYACTPLSIRNVLNEFQVLRRMSGCNFVPEVTGFFRSDNQVLLETNVFHGKRLANIKINQAILSILFTISEISISPQREVESSIKMTFAHGDFCPWNMMERKGRILLFDWEMAGYYPLGYDIFTYIFQTTFLLKAKKAVSTIISEHEYFIEQYFYYFKIQNWKKYLKKFCQLKIAAMKKKNDKKMLNQFNTLLEYAEKT